MLIKQISIFIENKHGRLAKVTGILGDNDIDIRALSIADTTDFGVLRLIVNDPGKASQILVDNGFTVSINDVIAIEVEDKPGGLAKTLSVLDRKGISIEYMYAFVGNSSPNSALVIFRVEEPEKALEILKSEDVHIKSPEEVYRIK
ncbi:MAG: ACT domain-containing protein [Clostridiaceae bacterium]|nr:ACT domain-containing protein [Clostridiaceae bacterium]